MDFIKILDVLKASPIVWAILGLFSIIGFINLVYQIATRSTIKPRQTRNYLSIITNSLNKYEKLSISYDGEDISSFAKTEFFFWNEGKKILKSEHLFDGDPLRLEFKEGLKIYQLEYITTDRIKDHFNLEFIGQKNWLILKPDSMKKKDGIFFRIYHSGEEDDIELLGEINGIKGIKKYIRSIYNIQIENVKSGTKQFSELYISLIFLLFRIIFLPSIIIFLILITILGIVRIIIPGEFFNIDRDIYVYTYIFPILLFVILIFNAIKNIFDKRPWELLKKSQNNNNYIQFDFNGTIENSINLKEIANEEDVQASSKYLNNKD